MDKCKNEATTKGGLCSEYLTDRPLLVGNAISAIEYIINHGLSGIDDFEREGTTSEVMNEVHNKVVEFLNNLNIK